VAAAKSKLVGVVQQLLDQEQVSFTQAPFKEKLP
jgi:hypothetical protein